MRQQNIWMDSDFIQPLTERQNQQRPNKFGGQSEQTKSAVLYFGSFLE